MKKALVLMVLLAFGLMFSGCAAPPDITAEDLKAGTTIKVEWTWPGAQTVVTPAKYKVWSASTPLPGDVWTQVYGGATGGTATTFNDTIGAGVVRFYKVQAFAADGTPSDVSWPEGGSTAGIPVNPIGDVATLKTWENAGTCLHTHVETYLYPDVLPPDSKHLGGTAGGTLDIDFAWITSPSLALATFVFADFQDTCTNGLKLNGTQSAPVSIPSFDGLLRGYLDYGAAGWQAFNIIVKNKNSTGGSWYIKVGANSIAYVDYSQASTSGCTCTIPANTCCEFPPPGP